MNISIDYDGTYTNDPELWEQFIKLAQARGHDVRCVTKREPECGAPNISVPVIYCSRQGKRRIAEANGFKAHVWIDDSPEGILHDDAEMVRLGMM